MKLYTMNLNGEHIRLTTLMVAALLNAADEGITSSNCDTKTLRALSKQGLIAYDRDFPDPDPVRRITRRGRTALAMVGVNLCKEALR